MADELQDSLIPGENNDQEQSGEGAPETSEAEGVPANPEPPLSAPTPEKRQAERPDESELSGFTSNRQFTFEELQELEQEPASFEEGVEAAVESEWISSHIARRMGTESFDPDPNFRLEDLSKEQQDRLYKGIPEELLDEYEEASSWNHALAIRDRLDSLTKLNEKLSSMGWEGSALQIGAAIFDPAAIAATVATEGVAAPFIWGAKINRFKRMLNAGTVAGGTNAAIEGALVSMDPRRGPLDIVAAGGAGWFLGGLAGAVGRTADEKALNEVGRELGEAADARAARQDGFTNTDEFPEQAAVVVNDAEDTVSNVEFVPASSFGEGSTVGAARTPGARQPINPDAEDAYDEAEQLRPNPERGRISLYGQLAGSKHAMVARLTDALYPDGIGVGRDGRGSEITAGEIMQREFNTNMNAFYRKAEPELRQWIKDNGGTWFHRYTRRDEFFREVGRAVRQSRGQYTTDPHVNAVADDLRRLHADILKTAKEVGVRGFEDVADNASYIMRVHSQRKLNDALERFGEDAVDNMIARAFMRGSDEGIELKDALRVAKAYRLRVEKLGNSQDINPATMFSSDQRETLRAIVSEEIGPKGSGELSMDDVNRLVSHLEKKGDGKATRAKRRLAVDETFRDEYTTMWGGRESLGFEDILEENAETLFRTYSRQMSGQIGMANMGFKSANDVEGYIEKIKATRQTSGLSQQELDEQVDKLRRVVDSVYGRPLNKITKASNAMRMIRDYNFMRVMNQVGFAQIAEAGVVLGTMGFKALFQMAPTIGRVFSRARDGHFDEPLLDEIDGITAPGSDRMLMTANNRFDDYGVMEAEHLGKLERLLNLGGRATADLSGMNAITAGLERIAALAAVQKFANLSQGAAKINPRRLASLGINDEETAERVLSQMRKHVGWTQGGATGRRVSSLNLDQWDDSEARAIFVNALDRWTKRMVQKNNVADMSQWMTTDMGKMLIQFRTFATVAYEKQLRHGLAMRDMAAFNTFMLSMFFGGLAYTAQTYVNSLGRDDQDRYLDERLSMKSLATAAFQRAGFATMLPGAVDTMANVGGFDPLFSHGRSTGMAASILAGNPTVDLGTSLQGSVRGAFAPMINENYDYSQQDLRNQTGAMAFQNLTGIRNMVNLMGQDLPRFSQPR